MNLNTPKFLPINCVPRLWPTGSTRRVARVRFTAKSGILGPWYQTITGLINQAWTDCRRNLSAFINKAFKGTRWPRRHATATVDADAKQAHK